jgi:hypothetical protein
VWCPLLYGWYLYSEITFASLKLSNSIPFALSNETCSSIVRGRWFIVIKKATRQQFYGMLTGSVIIDSAQTDNHHIYDAKVMLFVSNNK